MVKKKQQHQQQTKKSSASLSVQVDTKTKNASMVTLVEMEGSPNSNRTAVAAAATEPDKNKGTPPPSRSPSPPPTPTSEVKQDDNQSAWSIEIEELTSEPRPGTRPTRSKKKSTSQEGTKPNRSSSWAHTLRNSFKRKKNKTIAAEQLPNNGLNANPPQDSEDANEADDVEREDNTEDKEEESLPPRSRSPSPGPEQDDQSNWSIEIEEVKDEQKSTRRTRKKTKPILQPAGMSRSASWSRTLRNSFKRKKNKTIASDDLYKPEQVPDDFAIEADSSAVTTNQPPPPRSFSFQSFRQRKSVSAVAEPENEEKAVTGKIKAIKPEEKDKGRTSAMVISKSSPNVGDVESLPADIKSNKANVFSSFFRKKTSTDSPTSEEVSSKGVKMRNSFGILNRRKSTDESTIAGSTPTIKIEQDGGSKKTRRSVSMMFGSSFSLKRMFHQHDTPVPEVEEEQRTPPTSILVKRSPHPSPGRPKSVQIDDSPAAGTSKATQQRKPNNKNKQTEKVEDKETAPDDEQNKQKTEIEEHTQPEATAKAAPDSRPTPPVDAPVADAQHGEVSSSPERSVTVAATSSVDPDPKMPEISAAPVDSEVPLFTSVGSVCETLGDILGLFKSIPSSTETYQLRTILNKTHLQALLSAHDTISVHQKAVEKLSQLVYEPDYYIIDKDMPADVVSPIRVVGLRKNPGEPLGLTVKTEDGQLVIARILGGGAVDRQGLLRQGDIIGEVNGVSVRTAEQLQVEIARCKEHIQLKILPTGHENGSNGAQVGISPSTILSTETLNSASMSCVRAHFDYDPKEDKLLPCPEIGLPFKKGDILQVVNQSDPNWWQAKKVGWSGPAGLIPSQELEERRKAFVSPEADFVHKIGFCGTRISKKKKKMMYQIKSSVDLDKAELLLYEEVTRMPPFRRKTLVLVGSEGIGRRTLKNRLINSDPDRFGTTMPHTSRPMRELEEDGMGYWFVSREEMEHDVRDHQFLECGEHNGHLYGTKLDTIRTIIRQGKMCVLDCSPQALKILHNSPEFMPYCIFLAAPGMDQLKGLYENARYSSRNLGSVGTGTFDRSSSIRFSSRRARTLESLTSLYEEEDFKNALEQSARIQRTYEKYFDQIIVNEDPDQTFRKVVEALEILSNQHQWVPVSWVY